MELAATTGGVPVLGYLVAYKFVDALVPVDEWRGFLTRMSGEYDEDAVLALQVEPATPADAFSQAIGELRRQYDDSRASVRYLFRPEVGARRRARASEMLQHIVRETFPAGAPEPRHEVVASVAFDRATAAPVLTVSTADPVVAAAVHRMFDELRAEQERQSQHFPAEKLRHRFDRVVEDCKPIYYDANHYFRVILRDHAEPLRLLGEAVEWLSERAGGTSRRNRFEVTVLPLPNTAEHRGAVSAAYAGDVEETLAGVEEAVQAYLRAKEQNGGEAGHSTLTAALCRVNAANAAFRAYEQEFAGAQADALEKIASLRRQAQALLGRDADLGTRGYRWVTTRQQLSAVAAEVGDWLARLPGHWPLIRPSYGTVSWSRGSGADAAVVAVQTDLDDPLADEATVNLPTSLGNLPPAAQALFTPVLTGCEVRGDAAKIINALTRALA